MRLIKKGKISKYKKECAKAAELGMPKPKMDAYTRFCFEHPPSPIQTQLTLIPKGSEWLHSRNSSRADFFPKSRAVPKQPSPREIYYGELADKAAGGDEDGDSTEGVVIKTESCIDLSDDEGDFQHEPIGKKDLIRRSESKSTTNSRRGRNRHASSTSQKTVSFKESDDEVVVEATIIATTPSPKPESEKTVCVYCQLSVPDECPEWVYGRHCFETVKHSLGDHLKVTYHDVQRTYLNAYKNAQHFHYLKTTGTPMDDYVTIPDLPHCMAMASYQDVLSMFHKKVKIAVREEMQNIKDEVGESREHETHIQTFLK